MVRFIFLCVLSICLQSAYGSSILRLPWEARKSNIIRVTRQVCDDCATLEDVYKDNGLVFLLFYERNLISHHNYKSAIVAGFFEVCKSLRWSQVVCGVVDMVEDKGYAEKYIDPKTAPAHIAVRAGEAVPSKKEWVDVLLKKPGDKAAMLWHLKQQLAPDEVGDPFHISTEVADAEQLKRLTSQHEVVVVAHLAGAKDALDTFRAAAQQLVLEGEVAWQLNLPETPAVSSKKAARKQQKKRQRARILFVALTRDGAAPNNLEPNQVAAFVGGQMQRQPPNSWTPSRRLQDQLFLQETSECFKRSVELARRKHLNSDDWKIINLQARLPNITA